MTNEELLKPRYKVIADWPGNRIPIGSICTISTHNCGSFNGLIYHVSILDKHPHLFKKLEWWEERKPEDLPKYVKTTNWGVSFYQWHKHDFPYDFLIYNGIVPATEEEYLKNQL